MKENRILGRCLSVTLILAALLGPAFFWNGGVLEEEATLFVAQYSADRPLLQKVFDPDRNDFGTYQARELSYFVDLVDAWFYAFVARTVDRTLFIPLSSLIASLLIAGVWLAGVRRTMPGIRAVEAALLAACLVSSFQFISTMGVFYRSGKPLLAATILCYLFHVRRVHLAIGDGRQPPQPVADGLVAAALCLAAGLLDRQGFVYVMMAVVALGIHYRLTKQLGALLVAAVASAGALVIYDLALAPVVIRAVNGYWPDFSYQSMVSDPEVSLLNPRPLRQALELLVANAGELFGGWRWGGLALLPAIGLLLPRGRTRAYLGFLFAAQVLMFALMIHRHPQVAEWIDHRYWYYPLPYLVTVVFALAMGMAAILPRLGVNQRRLLTLTLVAIVAGNVSGLKRERETMRGGEWFGPVYVQSELLKASLRSGTADERLVDGYRDFFALDRRFRQRSAR